MAQTDKSTSALRAGMAAALVTAAGILLSGPIGLLLVGRVAPSQAWQGPAVWATGFHPIQTFPFFGGFLLLGGYVATMAALYQIARPEHKTNALIAVIFTAAFTPLIFFNYITQTTFLPALAAAYTPAFDPIITALAFSNPNSLCWAIEMWGYALLGVATWAAAPVFHRGGLERVTAGLMVANGIMSLVGGAVTAFDLDWVFSSAGLANYAGWNVLVLALAICMALALRQRMKAEGQVVNEVKVVMA